MPMTIQRLWGKPYNPAALLAGQIGKRLGLPVYDLLGRDKDFYCKYPLFAGKVILVDDVVTTGATMSAAAKALKSVGAKEILALSIV